ncbi:YolD-like family protein [Oceanobacillus sojae]|uniref:YolD-like protein n=1 Tax=Oceanobacillus sojae TaxID=582851 RepID=A0A511ZE05_9BACI|nr:YolD-like family protein [Oceanobacillus sojae]GEN85641.1 hypothetical protein OSO01_03800 [Oceanobacillus sojae]
MSLYVQQEIGFQLMMAHKDNLLIKIEYHKDNNFYMEQGYIDSINYEDRYIKIVNKFGRVDFTKINLENIVKVFLL